MVPRDPTTLTINGVIVDVAEGRVRDSNGADVALRPQAFDVLRYLLKNNGRLVTKDELMQAVWPGVFVTDDSLVQCVRDIRRVIGDDKQELIKAVPKRGYRVELPRRGLTGAAYPNWFVAGLAALLLAGGAGAAAYRYLPLDPPAGTSMPVVTVLPFQVVDGDASIQGLAAGITEDLAVSLARFPEFEVAALTERASERDERSRRGDGATMEPEFEIQGLLQRQDDRLRISAKLVDVSSGQSLWSDRWEHPDGNHFAVQTSIAQQIANRLGGGAGLIQEVGRNIARKKPLDACSAYEFYLLGTERIEKFTRADIAAAIDLLKRAVELDPGFARAWVELYHSYFLAPDFGLGGPELKQKAYEAAETAVSLDPSDAEAHAVFAMSLVAQNKFAPARSEFDTALRLAPEAAEILIFYIGKASTLGRAERGASLVAKAIELDPNYPMWANSIFAKAYFMAGRYQEALQMLERQSPANYNLYTWAFKIGSHYSLGQQQEAKESAAKAAAALPDISVETIVNAPGFNDAERMRLLQATRFSGLPVCSRNGLPPTAQMFVKLPDCRRS